MIFKTSTTVRALTYNGYEPSFLLEPVRLDDKTNVTLRRRPEAAVAIRRLALFVVRAQIYNLEKKNRKKNFYGNRDIYKKKKTRIPDGNGLRVQDRSVVPFSAFLNVSPRFFLVVISHFFP